MTERERRLVVNVWLLALFACVLSAGCSWSPSRDNPIDPGSPYYEKPPQRNRPPRIDSVFVTTNCRSSELNPFCTFDIVAQLSDSDNNVRFDSIVATVDTYSLGPMIFDPTYSRPETLWFRVTRSQDDFPNNNLNELEGKTVRVSALDDSSATNVLTVLFPAPLDSPPPIVGFPHGDSVRPDTIWSDSVHLGWDLWPGPDLNHTFSVSVLYKNIFMIWDTASLARLDTFVRVTAPLQPSTDGSLFYTWYLTVTDSRGNQITSLPGYFLYFPPSVPPGMLRPWEQTLE